MNESVQTCGRARRRAKRRFLLVTLLSGVLLALVSGDARAQRAVDPEQGVVGVSRLLRGLGSVKRVLVIGAHPDDEDTALLTWLERGSGADGAYLSLNRGEGGQNLIGPELGVGLGLVRTGELLAARRLDGADQYFTRAYDFGYSKSATETFQFWPQDSLLADVVAVIREFRPQVVVSIFTGTRRDGHGQHQAAGILARQAFEAAGDPQRFPEQLVEGLWPWSPLKLYRSTRFDRDATTLEVGTGKLDPLYGRSYHQIAMASRSQHRSQDMGRIESLGPQSTTLELIESAVTPDEAADSSLFAGIDTSLAGMLAVIDDAAARRSLARSLDEYDANLQQARESLGSSRTEEVVIALSSALERLRLAIELAGRDGPGSRELLFALGAQERRLETALAAAAGVIVDAFADDDLVVPGQNVEIEVQIWNGGEDIVEVRRVTLRTPAGTEDAAAGTLSPGSLSRRRFRVSIPADAEPTRQYFLRVPRDGAVYAWPAASPERGLPLSRPVAEVEVDIDIVGQTVRRTVEAVYRFADQARGEVRRPVYVVPAVGLGLDPGTTVWPLGRSEPATFRVNLRGEAPDGTSGRLQLLVPPGWSVAPVEATFDLRTSGSVSTVEFRVEAPAGLAAGTYTLSAVAEATDGRSYRDGYSIIDYPHIRRSMLHEAARARLEAFELAVPSDLRVGYVPGAGDAVADAIRAMGIPVDILDERAVSSGDLSVYDVIVLGIRTYETNPALPASNDRFLDWVRDGGTLISQYQQYTYFNGGYAPYPMSARRPHDRVSDELAPVELTAPDHPVFTQPNRIRRQDFEGWVQERGLYFPNEWDERYRALIETSDPGEAPKRGGLLVAPLGDGVYIYTGLALFRQLPAGVPGAYRLLANLLSL